MENIKQTIIYTYKLKALLYYVVRKIFSELNKILCSYKIGYI